MKFQNCILINFELRMTVYKVRGKHRPAQNSAINFDGSAISLRLPGKVSICDGLCWLMLFLEKPDSNVLFDNSEILFYNFGRRSSSLDHLYLYICICTE